MKLHVVAAHEVLEFVSSSLSLFFSASLLHSWTRSVLLFSCFFFSASLLFLLLCLAPVSSSLPRSSTQIVARQSQYLK